MKPRYVDLGPVPVSQYPVSAWNKMELTREQLEHAWEVVGPTAEKAMKDNPLWIVLCNIYLEGLMHGHAMASRTVD